MARVFLTPALSLTLDPALFPLFFDAFGWPAALRAKKREGARAVARALWGGEAPATLAEAVLLLGMLGEPPAREAFREAAIDARAQGHFDDGAIDRALEAAGAPVTSWARMRAGELALRLLVARHGEEALEPLFERVHHRLARSLPAHVPCELAARTPTPGGTPWGTAVTEALRAAALIESPWAEPWTAVDEDGALRVTVLRGEDATAASAIDFVHVRPAEARVSIVTATPPLTFAYAAAIASATWGDPGALVERPALTLKGLQVLGGTRLRRLAMPSPVTRMEIVALQIDDMRGRRTESRGRRALAAVEPMLRAGGYLVRATFRFVIEGAPHAVDAYVELPRRLSISDPRFEGPVRAALAALGVFSPGAYGDDLTTLAPWVHP